MVTTHPICRNPTNRTSAVLSRDVGGERGQVGERPRGEGAARPRVELVPGQPALDERVLQRLDHLLAVGVARPEPATARGGGV
jgi:hypothetical protein